MYEVLKCTVDGHFFKNNVMEEKCTGRRVAEMYRRWVPLMDDAPKIMENIQFKLQIFI